MLCSHFTAALTLALNALPLARAQLFPSGYECNSYYSDCINDEHVSTYCKEKHSMRSTQMIYMTVADGEIAWTVTNWAMIATPVVTTVTFPTRVTSYAIVTESYTSATTTTTSVTGTETYSITRWIVVPTATVT